MSNVAQLRLEGVCLKFGGVAALIKVSFQINRGEIMAVIGPNGAGKTCILNCISGFYRPDEGEIYFEGREITKLPPHRIAELGIGRTFQNIALFTGMSVVDNLMAARHIHINEGLVAASIYFGKAAKEEVKHREVVERIIDFLDLKPVRESIVGSLPYGLRKRVELGRALALEPKVLLLDEPTAGMNIEEKEDMAMFILDIRDEMGCAVTLVEHDMGIVMDISDRVMALDWGQKIAEDIPREVAHHPRVLQAYLGEEQDVLFSSQTGSQFKKNG